MCWIIIVHWLTGYHWPTWWQASHVCSDCCCTPNSALQRGEIPDTISLLTSANTLTAVKSHLRKTLKLFVCTDDVCLWYLWLVKICKFRLCTLICKHQNNHSNCLSTHVFSASSVDSLTGRLNGLAGRYDLFEWFHTKTLIFLRISLSTQHNPALTF